MRRHVLFAALAASVFAGCSGGGGGSSPTPVGGGGSGTGSGSTNQAENVAAISDANAIGSPLRDFSLFDTTADPASAGVQASASARGAFVATGTCNNGLEFYAPDKNGDANSTELIVFYDSACTDEARDTQRIYSSTGTATETVNINVSLFAPNNATPIATRSTTHNISNATFNQYGYPIVADGYDLQANDTLNIAASRTIASSHEYLIAPGTGSNGFCSDSAGYNATGIASTGKTYGWNGGVNGGTRVINSDGSVTWTATHAGSTYVGAIGGLSILRGSPNTACPITTPMFTLGGGTATGSYSIPVVVTMLHGMIESISITNATLNNGDTLNVSTNAAQPPSSSLFITGSVANGSTQIATFAVNAFGDGTLTSSKTGAQYVITDWRVIR